MKHRASAHTAIGQVKARNEDAYLLEPSLGLYMVCDGIGGRAAGEVASQHACDLIRQGLGEHRDVLEAYSHKPTMQNRQNAMMLVRTVMDHVNTRLYEMGRDNPELKGMASTAVCVLVLGRNALVAHVGDSRAYLLRGANICRLTDDHSLVHRQLQMGVIGPEDALHSSESGMIIRALGMSGAIDPDVINVELMPGDIFLVCSDGLSRYVTSEELLRMVGEAPSVEAAAHALVNFADQRSGKDNITAVLVQIDPKQRVAGLGPAEKIEMLRQIPPFQKLTYRESLLVLSAVGVKSYEAGQRVIECGSPAEKLLIGVRGRFRVARDGRTIAQLPNHTTLGEAALILGRPHEADVYAEEDAKVLVIERPDLNDLIRRHPSLGSKFLWSFCQVLAGQLVETGRQLAESDAARVRPVKVQAASGSSVSR